ncbi:phosphatidylethanolamine-binding protein [Trametes gibbosa]|nr:phosphatidylethanolamine-binding protein [Trametes gibbosa]
MLALRRLPRFTPRLASIRGHATLDATVHPQADAPPPPPPSSVTAQSSAVAGKQAENSSGSAGASGGGDGQQRNGARRVKAAQGPRDWCRPIAKGVEPAYDYALRYILKDAAFMRKELEQLRAAVEAEEKKPERDEVALESLREQVRVLEIQSEVNIPEVRWKAKSGLADMSKPIYRHLVEQKWREEGDLDLLMERIYQMNVVPDLLPELRPSFDLRIKYAEAPPDSNYLRTRVKRKLKPVEPGVFLAPEQTRRLPELSMTLFHTDTRLYTLLMVDLDVPDPENQTFTSYLHWLQPNIPLSAFTTTPPVPLNTHTRYVAPHPQRGTPYHRYVLLMLPQPSAPEPISVPVFEDSDRLGFDFRAFAAQYGLDGARGGGAHMWREVWDETVSHIYQHTLRKEEPRFGKMPRPDPYADLKRSKKYL